MFAPFNLPSNPSIKIKLREATVKEVMDFSDVMPEHEEALTTLFLNTVQDPASFVDSKKWTGDDRRLGLFWYSIHTIKNTAMSVPYECPQCQKTHHYQFDLRDLADHYQAIQGKPLRDLTVNNQLIRVRPHDGHALEILEEKRLMLAGISDDNPKARRLKSEIKIEEMLYWTDLTSDLEQDDYKRTHSRRLWLYAQKESSYQRLYQAVTAALEEMEHGLRSTTVDGQLMLLSPEIDCPELAAGEKGVATALRLRFRDFRHIPRI